MNVHRAGNVVVASFLTAAMGGTVLASDESQPGPPARKPTAEDVRRVVESLQKPKLKHFVYFIHPVREGFIAKPTDRERKLVGEHFRYLKRLTERGTVVLAGPSTDPPYTGIVIFRVKDRKAAEAVMKGDPAVAGGVFRARLSPFVASLSSLAGTGLRPIEDLIATAGRSQFVPYAPDSNAPIRAPASAKHLDYRWVCIRGILVNLTTPGHGNAQESLSDVLTDFKVQRQVRAGKGSSSWKDLDLKEATEKIKAIAWATSGEVDVRHTDAVITCPLIKVAAGDRVPAGHPRLKPRKGEKHPNLLLFRLIDLGIAPGEFRYRARYRINHKRDGSETWSVWSKPSPWVTVK